MLSNDVIGLKMAGPGIRYWELSRALAARHRVTLAAPLQDADPLHDGSLRLVDRTKADLAELVKDSDAVLCQTLAPRLIRALLRSDARFVLDAYDPIQLEGFEIHRSDSLTFRAAMNDYLVKLQNLGLGAADGVVCASDRQRDLWIGSVSAIGGLDAASYDGDPSLAGMFGVVPFGIPHGEPVRNGAGPRKRYEFAADDFVVLWGGGVWNWLDPLTVVAAVVRLAAEGLPIRLVFMGLKHPNEFVGEMDMTRRLHRAVTESGLYGTNLFVHEGWVPYSDRQSWLLDADVGVSAHTEHAEARYSFRTRVLDYLWAGLPVVVTEGDAMGDLVERNNLGAAIPAGDVEGWIGALHTLATDAERRQDTRARVLEVREQFRWTRSAESLERVIAHALERPHRPIQTRATRRRVLALRLARLNLWRARGLTKAASRFLRRRRQQRTG
jgi:glycosyltransferase involved in cell wall biosynthesis